MLQIKKLLYFQIFFLSKFALFLEFHCLFYSESSFKKVAQKWPAGSQRSYTCGPKVAAGSEGVNLVTKDLSSLDVHMSTYFGRSPAL